MWFRNELSSLAEISLYWKRLAMCSRLSCRFLCWFIAQTQNPFPSSLTVKENVAPYQPTKAQSWSTSRGIAILKVKQSRNRPGVAQRLPGGLGSQIFMTFGTLRWWGQPYAPAAFTPRKCSWYAFWLGAESTPGPWYGRKEYVTEKSSDTTGNRSRNRQTSRAAL